MKQQNRPYSALNIFDNLRGAIKKPEVIRILDALSTEGLIRAKYFGKARVYLVD
jgi:26S proteasome regulatory subunit (ATPase 3-interacting protein)